MTRRTTKRGFAAAVTIAAALGLAACGSSGLTTPSPASVTSASAAPIATAADPTPIATAADPTPVGGEGEAPGVVITAQNIAFDPRTLTVPANVPLVLVLGNKDTDIPHGIVVSDANGNILVKGEIITGPQRLPIALPALAPGTYTFVCPVHPNMTGTITAE